MLPEITSCLRIWQIWVSAVPMGEPCEGLLGYFFECQFVRILGSVLGRVGDMSGLGGKLPRIER